MLADTPAGLRSWFSQGTRFEKGLAFLQRGDLASLPSGRHEIDGDDVYALVLDYGTHPFNRDGWEAHRRYYDVQKLVSGSEFYTVAPVSSLMVKTPYDGAKDVAILSGEGEAVPFPRDEIVVFEPADGHQPGISAVARGKVRKVVVKIRV